jgi:hypothetical protein
VFAVTKGKKHVSDIAKMKHYIMQHKAAVCCFVLLARFFSFENFARLAGPYVAICWSWLALCCARGLSFFWTVGAGPWWRNTIAKDGWSGWSHRFTLRSPSASLYSSLVLSSVPLFLGERGAEWVGLLEISTRLT